MKFIKKKQSNIRNQFSIKKPVTVPAKKIIAKPILPIINYYNNSNYLHDKKYKIGILTIATGKYIQYADPLYHSIRNNFLTNHSVRFLLFTDSDKKFSDDVHVVKIQRKGFPGDTLFRYHYFCSEENYILNNFDYVYYLDIDMLIVAPVGNEIIPPINSLIGVCHPGFSWNGQSGSFEQNKNSTAYIDNQKIYYAGGFNGGYSYSFMDMSKSISSNIDKDLEIDYIAVWHDESHLNKYFAQNRNVYTLDPGYCYPESWNIPFNKKIIALDKNHSEVRS